MRAAERGEIGDDRQAAAARSTSATRRGNTSTPTGLRPMTVSASTSSRIFIEPISAVMALPERPAIMMAVISTPSLAQHQDADQVDDEDVGAEIAQLEGALLRDDGADDGRHQHDDRNGADAHAVDLVDDRREVDAVAAAELHLRAADGRAEDVHGGHEIVAHRRRRAVPSRLQRSGCTMLGAARAAESPSRAAASSTAPSRIDAASLAARHLRLDAARRACREQPLDQPGAGRVDPADAGKIDAQAFDRRCRFSILRMLASISRDPACRPVARQHGSDATPSPLAELDARR